MQQPELALRETRLGTVWDIRASGLASGMYACSEGKFDDDGVPSRRVLRSMQRASEDEQFRRIRVDFL